MYGVRCERSRDISRGRWRRARGNEVTQIPAQLDVFRIDDLKQFGGDERMTEMANYPRTGNAIT